MTAKVLEQAELPTEVVKPPATALVTQEDPAQVAGLLQLAIKSGLPVESIKELVELQWRYEGRQAEREFARAFAEFQRECPPIPKLSTSKKATGSGTNFDFTYADLETIATAVAPFLHKHGFSYSWSSETTEKSMTTTCTLRHSAGHREASDFTCPVDSNLPIGSQQKSGAALSYGRRYSLVQVLGITTADPDTDGEDLDPTAITESQAANLEALMQEVAADRLRFLKYLGVDSLAALPARRYNAAVAALEAKRKRPT